MSDKFIVCGDLHWRAVNPQGRKDCFQEALTQKLYEVFNLARKVAAKAIIIPGDIFDSPHLSLSTIGDLAEILFVRPCPVLAVAGNHDEFAGNLESVARTPYGLLCRMRLIQDLHDRVWQSGRAAIYGHGFNNDTDRDKEQYGLRIASSKDPSDASEETMATVNVTHGMLLENPLPYEVRHTLISELEQLPELPDVLINGHYHAGTGIQMIRNTLVINPGALCRLSASAEEMSRQVQVAVLTVNGHGDCQAELVPLQCARPGSDVLSREHIIAEADKDDRISRFTSLLAAEGESKFLEVRDIVDDIARREVLPEAVVKDAMRRIAAAREELAGAA